MIDFEAIPDLDAPIAPWTPKVGDRVRVNGSIAECPSGLHDWGVYDRGRTGIVERVRNPGFYLNHRFYVRFEDSGSSSFAAWELEPLP